MNKDKGENKPEVKPLLQKEETTFNLLFKQISSSISLLNRKFALVLLYDEFIIDYLIHKDSKEAKTANHQIKINKPKHIKMKEIIHNRSD